MRRLVLFLVVLLTPLQAAFAALDAYCLSGGGGSMAACHRVHDDRADEQRRDADTPARQLQDCPPCHLACAPAPAGLSWPPAPAATDRVPAGPPGSAGSAPASRPERPKWRAPLHA